MWDFIFGQVKRKVNFVYQSSSEIIQFEQSDYIDRIYKQSIWFLPFNKLIVNNLSEIELQIKIPQQVNFSHKMLERVYLSSLYATNNHSHKLTVLYIIFFFLKGEEIKLLILRRLM